MDQEREFSNHSTDMDQEREVSNQSSDTDQEWEVTSHKTEIRKIVAHQTEIEVVYTDDNHKAAEIVDMYEQWLSKDEYKFMGLDFEYCDPEYKVANRGVPNSWISYAGVSTLLASISVNDRIAMQRSWNIEIPIEYHIDLQDLFQLERDRTGMADMAAALIDMSYKGMKKEFPSVQRQVTGEESLDEINLEYAARDGFVAYKLYHIIRQCNYG
ncbi:uncharacterized protein [Lolium perenne]|uniref:uncharacterized protein n=1 Tax=Lolium perenne TaxID=4522 RepID=UPI003A9A614E